MAIIDLQDEFKSVCEQIEILTKKKNEMVAKIKKEHCLPSGCNYGCIQVQITQPYWTFEFDLERFIQEQPSLYDEYLKPSYYAGGTKVVLLKGKEKQ